MKSVVALLVATLAFADATWRKPAQPFQVIGNIYYVGTAGLACYLIETPAGGMVIDGGLPESVPLIEKNIQALGFDIKRVRYLLNSHAHYDHAGGLAELKKASGAQMIASAGDAPTLNTGVQSSYGAGWDSKFPAVKVDRIVKDGDTVHLGGVTLKAVLTPGHTKGCTTWTTTVQNHPVVFYCSTSVPGYALVNNREYPAIVSDYKASFAKLRALPCDVFLSNHTQFFDLSEKLARRRAGAPNPFIDPTELRRYVDHSEAEFNEELTAQRRKSSRAD